jgi:hypothetical protein
VIISSSPIVRVISATLTIADQRSAGTLFACKCSTLVAHFYFTQNKYTKNAFSVDLEERVRVLPGIVRLENLKEMGNVPSDAQWLADIDERDNIRVFFNNSVFEKMYLALLNYHFGNTNFIELLNEFSRLLGIKEPPLEIRRPPL